MKTEMTLSQMAAELERRKDAKQDYLATTDKITLTTDQKLSFGEHALPLNEVAHDQIAAHLDIPTSYYNRLRAQEPELLAENVNTWLHKKQTPRMIRTLDGTARAFLSNKYLRVENEDIAEVVLPILLAQAEHVDIKSLALTEQNMYIKAVFPGIQGEVKKGDVVRSGICISNSEVGRGMVKISPFAEVLACTNGMVIDDGRFEARHVGGRISQGDGIYELLTDETLQADDKALLLKVRDVVAASMDEVRFNRQLELMRGAAGDRITGDPVEAVKLLSKKNRFTEGEQTSVLRHLIEGADLSRWGLLNAVTRTAQDVATYDRSHELEAIGGAMIALPKAEWRQLAEAA